MSIGASTFTGTDLDRERANNGLRLRDFDASDVDDDVVEDVEDELDDFLVFLRAGGGDADDDE